MRMKWMRWITLFTCLSTAALGQFGNPFTVEATLQGEEIVVKATVPAGHFLYAKELKVVDGAGAVMQAVSLPEPGELTDPVAGDIKQVYESDFEARYEWAPSEEGGGSFVVHYQGCNDQACFMPQRLSVAVEGSSSAVSSVGEKGLSADGFDPDLMQSLDRFRVGGTMVGFTNPEPFVEFLSRAQREGEGESYTGFRLFVEDPEAFMRESGLLLTLLFILIGGLALNLTPCVLPMIPINLAIIGAGAKAGSRSRGFLLGAVYGLGIALVYGALGLVVVLTGARFGAIQSSGWFNLAIALIFVVLALAMFDLFHIDFSRFQNRLGGGGVKRQGSFLVALSMGAVAALLAGACVAPVVIAVLLLATKLGEVGLVLPFVLGLGMALPWPFAGAGLSFLPKPGKWMEYVKYGFGIFILLFALYYGKLSYQAFKPAGSVTEQAGYVVVDGTTNEGFAEAIERARASGQSVLLDFWGTTCKNCHAMDATTLKDEAVTAILDEMVVIKYVADKPAHPNTEPILDRFEVQGLPTFIVLVPEA
jgi:thioredoxin:protein disulfide reductase